MASRSVMSGSIKGLLTFEPCVLCQSRQIVRATHDTRFTGASRPVNGRARRTENIILARSYATPAGQRLDGQRLRHDVDKRARLGFYTLHKQQNTIKMQPHTADAIYADFVAQRKNMSHESNIKRIVLKYKVSIEDLASLAIITFRIPELSDPQKRAMLPASQHKTVSAQLLQGCAEAEEPLAVIQILTAVYLSNMVGENHAKDLATLFTQKEIASLRGTLKKLSMRSKEIELGPDALTLQGLFLESENKGQEAKACYSEAIERSHLQFTPGSRHPMQFPLIAPWNALGYLLKKDKNPDVQVQAKTYFEEGAIKADDPLSNFELAALEDRSSVRWLQCTSKAAASGHRQAMANLAEYYRDVCHKDSPLLVDGKVRKALEWLLSWRQDAAAVLTQDWLKAASNCGHKPSSLQLANDNESKGQHEAAKEYLRKVAEPPSLANQIEEWPQLAQLAKNRLVGIKLKS